MKFHEYKNRYLLEGAPNRKLGVVRLLGPPWDRAKALVYMDGRYVGVVTDLRISEKVPDNIKTLPETIEIGGSMYEFVPAGPPVQ